MFAQPVLTTYLRLKSRCTSASCHDWTAEAGQGPDPELALAAIRYDLALTKGWNDEVLLTDTTFPIPLVLPSRNMILVPVLMS